MSAPINSTFRVLAHPLRVRMLNAMVESDRASMSPILLAKALDATIGDVSYHMGVLKRARLVSLESTIPRRGAIEHFYAPTGGVKELLESAGQLAAVVERVSA